MTDTGKPRWVECADKASELLGGTSTQNIDTKGILVQEAYAWMDLAKLYRDQPQGGFSGASAIESERFRQLEKYKKGHDAISHTNGELLIAAKFHIDAALNPDGSAHRGITTAIGSQISEAPIRNLVVAGALIAAEIDRLTNLKYGES